jgi:septal ring factor EnvC (AmiA/AmiB activator)
MTRSIDDIYTAIVSLSEEIANLPPDDPRRRRLEQEREQIRSEAAAVAIKGRHPRSVELEIEAIEQRLGQIDALLITEGYMEKRAGKNIQDPGAYSIMINRLLEGQHADEVEKLTAQLALLRQSDDTDAQEPEPSS